ncbi:TonB-dependent receptor plug domain-containing protein [Pseudoduganella albidiflava]|uniref:TonB-dependent receptor n=1 Tax=Pseudoduganella albidiflava TaxID=321983 RepID=A0A411WZV3_9BURK|nr:TonB-dependent receptor [Pseudoduganella albidiflava]QBI02232.1 TonB-dependent receptor [Pseudoduganella albidiflava]GGY59478.1 TonB-dependent receptor [Pseudoduganella albidiflava]
MRTPTQRTLINLAVIGACALLAAPGHARQATGAADTAANPASPATPASPAGEAAAATPEPAQEGTAAAQQDAAPATAAQTSGQSTAPGAEQGGPPAGTPTQVVQVSGTRIAARGFSQPTPTTSLSTADLERAAKPNLFNTLAELPALQGSTGRTTSTNSTSSGIQGLSSLSLRGLGTIRTLTLLDGQRVVGANVTGVTDVSQFPQLLVKRVDVVTGGASASYGSDAIGGAVNFITDKKFKGFKFNVEGGQTKYHDDEHGTLQAAWGKSFIDDRLHVTLSGEFMKENGIDSPGFGEVGPNGRTWFQNSAYQIRPLAQTTDGRPQYTVIHHAQQYQYAKYGLITNGPLQGTAFGEGGAPYRFQYGSGGVPTGTGAVTNCVNPFCIGGDLSGSVGAGTNLAMDLKRKVAYTRVSWDLDADNEIYFTANWAQVKSHFSPNPGAAKNANLTIQCDNPFVPASIQAACAANNITSFQYGTANANFPANINVHPTRTQRRFVVGADGKVPLFGKEWSYDAYVTRGENTTTINVHDITLNARYNAAIDAVRLPNGSIACRNPVAAASGCVPVNIIGNNPISPGAWAYIAPLNGPRQHTTQSQDVASLNMNGEAFEGWAGPVLMAFGAEYRREKYQVRGDPYGAGVDDLSPSSARYPADPILNSTVGNNWYAGNYHNGDGSYSVREAYLELNMPLLKSDRWGEINLNLADRPMKYSTAGSVNTWKAGATWQTPVDGLRLRAVTSKDVRAPNLSELFAAPVVINNVVQYQGDTISVQQRTVGNTNLRPEVARNSSFGIILSQPSWAPGFSASVDYFDIKVTDVISALTAQQEVDLCVAGNQEICGALVLNSPGNNSVTLQNFNLASLETKGVDVEAAYRTSLAKLNLPGRFTVRALATRTLNFITNTGVVGTIPAEGAGVNLGGTPKWKLLAQQTWENDKMSFTLSERWFSDGVYNNEFIECQTNCPTSTIIHPTIFDNKMKGATYVDFGGSYNFTKQLQAYFKIDNLADRDPEPAPQANASFAINPTLYDVVGRTYRIGLRGTY